MTCTKIYNNKLKHASDETKKYFDKQNVDQKETMKDVTWKTSLCEGKILCIFD